MSLTRRSAAASLAASSLIAPATASARMAVGVHRTPEARFEAVPDFPYAPRYLTVDAGAGAEPARRIRLAYYVAGAPSGRSVLLMHGNPEWAFIYRRMAAELVRGGCRVFMVDLPGFGRSDKPLAKEWYSYARLIQAVDGWWRTMRAGPTTLFCQDWGGLIGLRLVDQHPKQFVGVITANTALPFGQTPPSPALRGWLAASQQVPRASLVLAAGSNGVLSKEALAAYDAPFDTPESLVAMRVLPGLIPIAPTSPGAAENAAAFARLRASRRPWLCLYGTDDPITRDFYDIFRDSMAGAQGQPHGLLKGGHFIQEVQPIELSQRMLAFMRSA